MKRCFAFFFALALVVSCGCYQRTVAPELTYDQSQVDQLDQEIKKMEWD